MSYLSLIVAVVATFAGYNIYQSQRVESIMSDLTMANVEALAGSEINDEDCVSASNRYCSVLIV
ncbi:NVEALA domain-containing protein, partial [Bacteroides fragilis]